MCGLCGVYSTSFVATEKEYFRKLLFLSSLRGEHSTGVMKMLKDGNIRCTRSLLASPEFLKTKGAADFLDITTPAKPVYGMVGHTRHATKGEITIKNAHPFAFDRVVGMHNGTIHKDFPFRKKYATDSEALYRLINDKGLTEALNEVNAYDTAYALQFVDKEAGTMNFVRNTKRPLSFTYIYGTSTLLWASEKMMLEMVLAHKNYTANSGWKGDTEAGKKFFTLKPNHLLSWKIGDSPGTATITDLEIEEKKSTTVHGFHGGSYGGSNKWPTDSSYKHGSWRRTDSGGYQWVPKKEIVGKGNVVQLPDRSSNASTSTTDDKDKTLATGDHAVKDDLPWEETGTYSNAKDKYSKDELDSLQWLRDQLGEKEPDDDDGVLQMRGHRGAHLTERRFRHLLGNGCFSCGSVFDLDDASDWDEISRIHWWDEDCWACDDCYNNSDGDWVRCSIEDDWGSVENTK